MHPDDAQQTWQILADQVETFIEIDAPPGKVIALLGPTGSGKSTTLSAMIDHILVSAKA